MGYCGPDVRWPLQLLPVVTAVAGVECQGRPTHTPNWLNSPTKYSSPLWWSACNGHTDVLAALIASGAPLGRIADEALLIAAENGHGDVVAALIAQGVDKNGRDRERRAPAVIAAINGRTHVIKVLISNGANVSGAYHLARGMRHDAIVNVIDAHRASVDAGVQARFQ